MLITYSPVSFTDCSVHCFILSNQKKIQIDEIFEESFLGGMQHSFCDLNRRHKTICNLSTYFENQNIKTIQKFGQLSEEEPLKATFP